MDALNAYYAKRESRLKVWGGSMVPVHAIHLNQIAMKTYPYPICVRTYGQTGRIENPYRRPKDCVLQCGPK